MLWTRCYHTEPIPRHYCDIKYHKPYFHFSFWTARHSSLFIPVALRSVCAQIVYVFTRFCDIWLPCKSTMNDVHFSPYIKYDVISPYKSPFLGAESHLFIQIDYRSEIGTIGSQCPNEIILSITGKMRYTSINIIWCLRVWLCGVVVNTFFVKFGTFQFPISAMTGAEIFVVFMILSRKFLT